MKFCEKCDNMMYLSVDKLDDGFQLKMLCRNCNFSVVANETLNEPIFSTYLRDDLINYKRHSVVELKNDPTMPRLKSIICANDGKTCTRNNDEPNNVMYMKFDAINMKYMYLCCYCDTFWKA